MSNERNIHSASRPRRGMRPGRGMVPGEKAKDLKGKLLICQGAVDPVVVWEQSLSFIRECIKNNVQVDYFPYPCAEHNVMGRDRIHLMQKVTNYFEDYLR